MKSPFLATLILGVTFIFVSTAQAQWHPDFDVRGTNRKPRAQTAARRQAVAKPRAARTSNFSWGESSSGQQQSNQRRATSQNGVRKPGSVTRKVNKRSGYIKFDGIDGEANVKSRSNATRRRRPNAFRPNPTGDGTTRR